MTEDFDPISETLLKRVAREGWEPSYRQLYKESFGWEQSAYRWMDTCKAEQARSAKLLASGCSVIKEFRGFRPQNYTYFEKALQQLEQAIAEYEASK